MLPSAENAAETNRGAGSGYFRLTTTISDRPSKIKEYRSLEDPLTATVALTVRVHGEETPTNAIVCCMEDDVGMKVTEGGKNNCTRRLLSYAVTSTVTNPVPTSGS